MSEKVVKLKIKLPRRYVKFIAEYCEMSGLDRRSEMQGMVESSLVMYIENLDIQDRVRLVGKYHLEDIYTMPAWMEKQAFEEMWEDFRRRVVAEGSRTVTREESAELGLMMINLATRLGKIEIFGDENKKN